RIASITSIDGVNKGSKVADVVRGILPPGSYVEGGANAIANALGDLINALSGADNPQNGLAALETLTTPGTTSLNDA
ncbi:MAG TPA: alpha/beta hydrolase, partial [Marinobacter adhaerens]|nr:alpha/beta hydrolase [Marinobacter adhaerens]